MPEIALAPDISGVCSKEGTLAMTSKPTKMARTKTVSDVTSDSIILDSLFSALG
jgi:hypothetical protein